MRLYTEWIRHEHRSKDEVKRQKALYQETVLRRRMGLSKVNRMLVIFCGEKVQLICFIITSLSYALLYKGIWQCRGHIIFEI